MEFSPPCTRFLATPQPTAVSPLAVRRVGPGRCAYHGRGLLGPRPDADTLVATPCPGARKGFWGIRPLTPKELLQVYDIGERFLGALLPDFPSLKSFQPLMSLGAAMDVVSGLRGPSRPPSGDTEPVVGASAPISFMDVENLTGGGGC